MSNELALIPFNDIRQMAEAVAKGGLFGVKTTDQALSLMLLAQSENMHPMRAIMEFDLIQGKPARKSWSMLDRFLTAGGTVKWHERTDVKASATFSHPQGGTITVDWDMTRATKAGLAGKDNWKKFSRAMLSARVVSEGVRAIYPGATGGLYETGEVEDMRDVTPPKPAAKAANGKLPPHDPETGEVIDAGFPASDNIGPEPELPVGQPQQTDESVRAEAFANEAIARIDKTDSAEKIEAWFVTNKDRLGQIQAANEEAYDAIVAAAGYRKRKLLGAEA